MTGNRVRLGACALLGAATLATLAACNASGTANAGGTDVQWKTVSAAPASSAVKQILMFPNTTFTAVIESYDAAARMIDFQVQTWVPGGPDNGHYAADPSKPGIYRLPLAANVRISSVSRLCFTHSTPNMNGTPCTAQQLITGLEQGATGTAEVHVDATDHIDTIKEDYLP
jgi:hypothetical protein